MYPEYDPNELTLGQSFANLLRGVSDPNAWKQTGQSAMQTAQMIPNVAESLARGGVAQAVGTMGDLRDLRNTVQSYLPKSVQNFSNAAEFMTNPYAKALTQTAPTTEETLDFVPRATAPYEGYKQHETLGEYIAPSLGYFGTKALKVGKDLPIGLSIEDVTPPPAKVAEALRQPEKNALGFYSPLEEAVGNLQNQKGTGQQYLAQLLKTQGVKQEEVATRGLDTFLTENPKVTREQIAQYLRENPVELKETVIGADTARDLDSTPYSEYSLGEGRVLDDPDYVDSLAQDEFYYIKNDNPDLVENYRTQAFEDLEIDPMTADPSDLSRVDDLTDDYIRDAANIRAQEMYDSSPYYEFKDDIGYKVVGSDDTGYTITDPNGREVPVSNRGVYDINQVEDYIREDALDRGFLHYDDEAVGTKYHDYTLPNGENYKEVLIQYPQKPASVREMSDGKGWMAQGSEGSEPIYGKTREEAIERWQNSRDNKNYQSGHFDEPNILAHFRTTDRTIDGKKTLFVEEIQSDWHQAGRKKGYASESKPLKQEYDQKLEDWRNYLKEEASKHGGKPENFDKVSEEALDRYATNDLYSKLDQAGIDRMNELFNAKNQAWQNYKAKLNTNVPDAPFKKNWQELAMKRAMQMAAEGGYDRVAFTTGKQQANRYSLSKQIDSVDLIPSKEGDKPFVLQAWKDGRNVIRKAVTEDDLPDLIGKEAAKKLLEQEPTGLHRPEGVAHGNPNVFTGRELKGLDLDVGGEGMKGFYDKILPDFINKYGKKHGLKVGQTSLKDGPVYRDFNYWAAKKDPSMSNTFIKDSFDKQDDLYKEYLKEGLAKDQEAVHYFDLTPEAKESFIKKGQPMFAAAPAIGITDEDTRREVLEKLFNSK